MQTLIIFLKIKFYLEQARDPLLSLCSQECTFKESGKSLERADYQMLKSAMLRWGDTLVVKSRDRFSGKP